ncbi:MAG: hypothetical protein GEU79_09280 [Acidimicrobiia bacterium]|nr:hypothetical protein [Acidimicrobiia bacterium]
MTSPNPDPKPGRWILPLVVLGMVIFTYLFIRSLGDEEPLASNGTGVAPTTQQSNGTATPSAPPTTLAPGIESYFTDLETAATTLTDLQTQLSTANSGFDNDEVNYSETEASFVELVDQGNQLATQISELEPPSELSGNHGTIEAQVNDAAAALQGALEGLRSSDDGSMRRNAVESFDTAVAGFTQEFNNARRSVGAPPITDGGGGNNGTGGGSTTTAPGDSTTTTEG